MPNPTNSKEIGFSAEFRQAVTELADARKAEKLAIERKKNAEATIREILGDATILTISGVPAVKVVEAKNSGISKELLAEILDPATIASVTRTTIYTKLNVLDNALTN